MRNDLPASDRTPRGNRDRDRYRRDVNRSYHFDQYRHRRYDNDHHHHDHYDHYDHGYRYPSWCSTGGIRFSFYLSVGHYRSYSHYQYSHYNWWYDDWYYYRTPHYTTYSYGYSPVHYSYYRGPWYDTYCDWYYGSWYRPYTHVTKIVYTPTYTNYSPGYDGGYDLGTVYYDDVATGTSLFDEPPSPEETLENAWVLLADGYLVEAREAFEAVAGELPFDGRARIGSAIAAGLLGDGATAVASMRTALADDPQSINAVPVSDALDGHVTALVDSLEVREPGASSDADTEFLTAALRYILREDAIAYFAVRELVDSGDTRPSTLNLQDIVRAAMYDRLYE